MARFLLSVWHDRDYELDFSTPEAQARVARVGAFNDELQGAGAWVFAGGLHPASAAHVVRPGDGEPSVREGPYAEARAQMGGFWILEVEDLDAALACEGPIEVRPLQG